MRLPSQVDGRLFDRVAISRLVPLFLILIPGLLVLGWAEGLRAQGLPGELSGQIFLDAKSSSFNRDLNRQLFEGEVVVIGGGAVISADQVDLDRVSNTLTASGHIVVMSSNVVFTGESIIYHLGTGDFKMTAAIMVTNDHPAVEAVKSKILGFTTSEVTFEAERNKRLSELEQTKSRLRSEARRQAHANQGLDDDLIDKYAMLLARERLIQGQKNPSLARLGEEQRERFERRRAYWEEARKTALKTNGNLLNEAYFRLEGDVIERASSNDYYAENALWTPCLCDRDEAPAWGFRADHAEAQLGGYVDLYHPVLEIKGIPILYLPYLKLPIKDQRQSGFLMPSFGFERRSGNIYSQPVFFDFDRNADMTLTTDVYENRGTRLGVEYRYQQREHSGWEVRFEGIRDRLWLRNRGIREDLTGLYNTGLDEALAAQQAGKNDDEVPEQETDESDKNYAQRVLEDPDYWRALKGSAFNPENAGALHEEIAERLAAPSNAWRGAYAWRGVTFFAPRLSLVSNGEITSDHRYTEELYVPDDFREAFFGGNDAKAFSTAKARFHLDAIDFYAGLGTSYGDNFLSDERFEGQQMPLRLKLMSRMFSILPERVVIPVMAQLTGEYIRITDYKGPVAELRDTPTLGDGTWRRLKFDTVSPLITDSIITASHFADFEARYIEHAGLDEPHSEIRSWRTGVEFKLPIDGKGELPEYLQTKPEKPELLEANVIEARRYVHHLMDWRLRFSVRPSVVKRGPYTKAQPVADKGGANLAYFASDRYVDSDADRDVPEEDRMKEHQRVTLATNHAWRLFTRKWQVISGQKRLKSTDVEVETSRDPREIARQELLYSLDRPVSSAEDLYDETNGRWLINRYELTDQYTDTPVTLDAAVTYDFLDARERERQKPENDEVESALRDVGARLDDLKAELAREQAQAAPNKDVIDGLVGQISSQTSRRASLESSRQVLAKPWKDPTVNLAILYAGWRLDTHVRYDIYAKTAGEVRFSLSLPSILATNMSVAYTQTKEIDLLRESFTRTRERSISATTTLIPPVTSYVSLRSRVIDEQEPNYTNSIKTAYGFEYKSPSRCWGLQFSREKAYEEEERGATYVLRLAVVFMGEQRALPNMSPAVVRDTTGNEPD